ATSLPFPRTQDSKSFGEHEAATKLTQMSATHGHVEATASDEHGLVIENGYISDIHDGVAVHAHEMLWQPLYDACKWIREQVVSVLRLYLSVALFGAQEQDVVEMHDFDCFALATQQSHQTFVFDRRGNPPNRLL